MKKMLFTSLSLLLTCTVFFGENTPTMENPALIKHPAVPYPETSPPPSLPPQLSIPPSEPSLPTSILIYAAQNDRVDAVKKLLERDVEARIKDAAFLEAVRHGHTNVVDVLLSAGADVNARSPVPQTVGIPTHGAMTALMMASQDANVKIVKKLLDAGADPVIKDLRGKTARDYAVDKTLSRPLPPSLRPNPAQEAVLEKNRAEIAVLLDAANQSKNNEINELQP